MIVPSVPITIGITVTFIIHSFLSDDFQQSEQQQVSLAPQDSSVWEELRPSDDAEELRQL